MNDEAPEKAEEEVPPLTLEERFELFTYQVQEQLNRMEAQLISNTITTVAVGRHLRITKVEIEAVEAMLYASHAANDEAAHPPASETSAVEEQATPAVESATTEKENQDG